MSLRARVEDFIAHRADRHELIQLLAECTQAGDTEALLCVRRLAEDMYGGITFNFELKAPAAWELACWGDAGIGQPAEAIRANPTSKNLSLCVQILCAIASGSIGTPVFATDSQIDRLQRMVGTDAAVVDHARRSLLELALSMESDEELIDLAGKGFGPVGMLEPAIAREMFAAVSMRWLTVSVPVVARYRGLLADHPDDEPTFQRFFSEHPEMLDPMVVDVWPLPDLHGARKPDFVVRRSDGSYLVVEIETPAKPIVTRSDQLGAQASHAVAQVSEYKRFLERLPNGQVHFPAMDEVTCLVVIGLEGELGPSQMQALRNDNRQRHALKIVGFDWLASRAETMRDNMVRSTVRRHSARVV